MSPLTRLIILFLVLLALSILIYVLVVKFFYWVDRNEPPTKRR